MAVVIRKACHGDKTAKEKIIARYHERIYRLVFFRIKNRPDAEDITQEVFIKVLKNLPKLKHPERFKPWLYTIAINQVKDFYKKKRFLLFLGLGADLEPLPTAGNNEAVHSLSAVRANSFQAILDAFLQPLPKSEREIFLLKYIDGLTIAEIAKVLGRNENTVKTHLYRSVNKLRNSPSLEKKLFAEVYDVN